MNKREVVWLLIRLIGVGFVYLTLVSGFGLISAVSTFSSLPASSVSTNSNTETSVSPVTAPDIFPARQPNLQNKPSEKSATDAVAKNAGDEAVKNLLWHIFLIILYGAVAFYLLRDGRVLFALLNREGAIIKDTKEISSLGILDRDN